MPALVSRSVFLALGIAVMTAGPASAQQQPPKKSYDPNERICEDVTMTGSRLATKRFCATRAEWAEKRRQDREAIEKAQLGPCMVQTTGKAGRPSC
jgi:hypothetical protein